MSLRCTAVEPEPRSAAECEPYAEIHRNTWRRGVAAGGAGAAAGQSLPHCFLANDPTIPKEPAGQAFLDGLGGSGFIEGKNIIIERRFA